MDLTQKSTENTEYMINQIMKTLRVATSGAIKATHFDEDQYEDIKDIYELVMSKPNFSISEMEAVVAELGKLRKK